MRKTEQHKEEGSLPHIQITLQFQYKITYHGRVHCLGCQYDLVLQYKQIFYLQVLM